MTTADCITADTLIPELLQRLPQTRPVLDRYGLHGCGGELGPHETLRFFARAHDVCLATLLRELRAGVAETAHEAVETGVDFADSIYRPFFKAGIAVILSVGAVWGAALLLRIGFLGSFTAVGLQEVNAHGHAQIFGWVGLFVMGFAYQAFPRFKHTQLAWPKLAMATLVLMVAGVFLRSVFQPLLSIAQWPLLPALFGSILEIMAIALFAGIIEKTLRASGKPLAHYDYYILCALGWFLIQAIYGTAYFTATALAENKDALVSLVATWQGSLRDLQIHGFAMLMILGVSQRIFHFFYGLPKPAERRSLVVLGCLNLAIVGEVAGLILMRVQGYQWTSLWYGSVILMTIALAVLVYNWHIFSKPEESDRSLKFLRTAYAWLFLSFAMLIFLPGYQFGLLKALAPDSNAAQLGFSHAYYGAIRHAITVGFISLMIVGVAAKVVPTLNGADTKRLNGLWLPFVLINTGCAMRVGFQTLTDFTDIAFPIAGVSGLLEVTGLAIWGVHLWRIMNGRVHYRAAVSSSPMLAFGEPITAMHRVGEVLEVYPELTNVLIEYGFSPLANPVLRKTLAPRVSLAQAARLKDMDPDALVEALNAERGRTNAIAVGTVKQPELA
ncbi:MAG: DUF1858 domain-containing protein [Candidatus Hydrogenedentes bacterium]|nr:DUF1858 domain-containing protein [Candidatus Hydrogenedentota bacterium]